jgi:hypothetical protein
MRQQSEQVAKAISEQARAARDMTAATQNVSKEVGRITLSNRGLLNSSKNVLGTLTEIRQITERNAQGVNATLSGTANLSEYARRLVGITDGISAGEAAANGGEQRASKARARPAKAPRPASKERQRGTGMSEEQLASGDESTASNGEPTGEERDA